MRTIQEISSYDSNIASCQTTYQGVRFADGTCGVLRKEGNVIHVFSSGDPECDELIKNSVDIPRVTLYRNAERAGIELRLMVDGHPRRMYFIDGRAPHLGAGPGSPAYGPDGVDTGW